MLRPKIEEMQLRCILLFLFDKELKSKEVTKNVNDCYDKIYNVS